MSSCIPTTYKTRNWSDYNKTLKHLGSLSIWFDAEMVWYATSSGRRGRQQAYSDAAIQACLTIKVLFGLPLRQTTEFVESLLELAGLDNAKLQHFVSTAENIIGRDPIPRLIGALAPSDRQHRNQS